MMLYYGLFDVTFLVMRLYNLTDVGNRNSLPLSASTRRSQVPSPDVCSLSSERGSCRGFFRRYHFDKASGECFLFSYSGCGGNANNFFSEEECQKRCGKNETRRPQVPRPDVCSLSSQRGSCREFVRRYHFDKASGECIEFPYSGCGGNANNFFSEEECQKHCGKNETRRPQVPRPDVCSLSSQRGSCREFIRRYHFDKASGECVGFPYSGCGGNANNFFSEEECQKRCGKKETRRPQVPRPDVCSLSSQRGSCTGYVRRYYFDRASGECVLFAYTGCGGNANNFISEEECHKRCGKSNAEACGENEEYNNCDTACPLTCDNFQSPPIVCTLQCVVGCRCKEGYVKNTDGRCITPEQCSARLPSVNKRRNSGYRPSTDTITTRRSVSAKGSSTDAATERPTTLSPKKSISINSQVGWLDLQN